MMLFILNKLFGDVIKLRYVFLIIFLSSISFLNSENLKPVIDDGLILTKDYIKFNSPRALSLWEQCQKNGEACYKEDPLHNCSIVGHPHAKLFYDFVRSCLKGTVLDIGCGPEYIPLYLSDYPISLIAAVDPIGCKDDHPFIFYKGLAEYLPWQNETFDTIVIGTSLDHVILLDKVVDELHRLLKTDGKLIIWTSFVNNTKKYNPYDQKLIVFDNYHLFHFTKSWFEEIFNEKFNILNKVDLSSSESFYVFVPKNSIKSKFKTPDEIKKIIGKNDF